MKTQDLIESRFYTPSPDIRRHTSAKPARQSADHPGGKPVDAEGTVQGMAGPWWWDNTAENSKTRHSRQERLDRLGINEEEFQIYRNLFLVRRQRDRHAIRRSDRSWPQSNYRWRDDLILRHLCGATEVAIPFGDIVNQIVLDIDYHRGRSWGEVEETVHLVAMALPGEPLVYRSSHTEGIRMIWFLNKAVYRAALNEWAKNKLSKAGIAVASGKCEVRLGREPDRLPFGCGSMLLDPVALEPRYDLNLSQTLAVVRDHCQNHAVDPPTVLPATTGHVNHEYRQIIRACLDSGLPPDVTTNECLMKLAWHGRSKQGLEKDELKVFLHDWITKGHNGNSIRINDGKIHLVYDQIDRIVDELRAEPGKRSKRIMRAPLSREELLSLLDYPVDYKTAGGLYRLLCFSKAMFHHQFRDKRLQDSPIGEKIGTNKSGTVFHEIQDIPNGARNFHLYIDLSKQLLRRLKVPNASNTARFVADVERIDVIRHKRKAWRDGGKARQYWVNFPFDLTGEPLSEDFDLALWEVLGFIGIRKRFTRYQAQRIVKVIESKNRKESHEE